MGSSSSRPETLRPSPASPLNRRRSGGGGGSSSNGVLSYLVCGGSSSRATLQMEEHPDRILASSAEHCEPVLNGAQNPAVESSLFSGRGTASTSAGIVSGTSYVGSMNAREGGLPEQASRDLETNDRGKCLSESKELVAPCQVREGYSPDESYRNRIIAEASTSLKDQESSDPVSVNVSANKDAVNGIDSSENKHVSEISAESTLPTTLSPEGPGDSATDVLPGENHEGRVAEILSSDYGSIPHRSEPVTSHFIGNESTLETIPSGLGFLVSDREQGRGDGSILQVDVVSISSSIFSGSSGDTSNREARRNSRRLFWDAFSRRSSRRHIDSPTIFFSTDGADDLVAHERWLLDFSGDFLDDGIGSDSGYMGSRIRSVNNRRRHSRSEIWERLRGGLDENDRRTTFCPSGLHPDGTCSCESFLTSEESSTRASISRIVMLAEALFEVLDEIHRQPVSLSSSMMSLPAPESVVDSFPLRNHKKANEVEGGEGVEQCYICLAEYEEGDKIRALPCNHEFHMACVDKWLKEIHGICPLCRGDVRQGTSEPAVSTSEVPSM